MPENPVAGSSGQGRRAGGTRVIWRKLDCHFFAVIVKAQERQLGELLVGQRQGEPVPEPGQGRVGHVLLLVGDVLALARFPIP